MIAVIDYGMGNLRSVQKALEVVGADAKITSDPKDLKKAEKIVFPGVGSFGDSMRELKKRGLEKPLKEAIKDGKPFLGLCLGLQLLFEKSEESPGVKGLCVLKGEVKRFRFRGPGTGNRVSLKVPHMGWNNITRTPNPYTRTPDPGSRIPKSILTGVPDGSYMYFVHSYYAKPKDPKVSLTTTEYGIKFASGICKDNVYAFQFHPEKSQELGLKILKNFVRL